MFYRRRLPHWLPDYAILFVTWRLRGSPPPTDPLVLRIREGKETSGLSSNNGRMADDKHRSSAPLCCRTGPRWLEHPRIANVVDRALAYGEEVAELYTLHAWVIMPNHVHVILQPRTELGRVMRWPKGRTARVANNILGRTGQSFWQDESFDHWIQSEAAQYLINYVEANPVKAGLVDSAEQWLWSSARQKADDKRRSSAPLSYAHS
jgi:putative transposase